MANLMYLIAGGVLGTLARYSFSVVSLRLWGVRFPYGTLFVNLAGCFLIGIFIALTDHRLILSSHTRLLLVTGFCGAFTTFSTWIMETSNLLSDGSLILGCLNLSVSVVAGFLLFRLGHALGSIF